MGGGRRGEERRRGAWGRGRQGGRGGLSAPRTRWRRDASRLHPATARPRRRPQSPPRLATTAVFMDNSCLLDLLIRCFAMTEPEDLNFTAFTDLCRLCSLKSGPRLHLFDKEAEQRQILYKLRSCLPTMVSSTHRRCQGGRSRTPLSWRPLFMSRSFYYINFVTRLLLVHSFNFIEKSNYLLTNYI